MWTESNIFHQVFGNIFLEQFFRNSFSAETLDLNAITFFLKNLLINSLETDFINFLLKSNFDYFSGNKFDQVFKVALRQPFCLEFFIFFLVSFSKIKDSYDKGFRTFVIVFRKNKNRNKKNNTALIMSIICNLHHVIFGN